MNYKDFDNEIHRKQLEEQIIANPELNFDQPEEEQYEFDDSKNNLQRYFKDVKFVYDKNDNNIDIEWSPENRQKLIEMNLKCVVSIAKAYRNMGLSLEELISAGNEGLCIAFDKYKPERNTKREELLNKLEEYNKKTIDKQWIEENVGPLCVYGKLKKKYNDFLSQYTTFKKSIVINWVNKNIKKATFNSVAMLWVNAAIHQELDNNSRIIRKPKIEIEREKLGNPKEVYLDINAPISDGGNNTLADVLDVQDSDVHDMDIDEAHLLIHDLIKKLFTGIKGRDRRIVLQRFGVGYVRPMLPKEIGELENISVARVSQIINITIQHMKDNAKKLGINMNDIYQILEDTSKEY